MGRNGEESVEKKGASNLDTGLIRGIILMIIPLSSPLDFVLVPAWTSSTKCLPLNL